MKNIIAIVLFYAISLTNSSAQWVQTNGPIFGYPLFFAASNDSSSICLGFRTGGIYFSTDHGISWKKNDGGKYPNWDVPKILFIKNQIFASSGFYIIRTVDNGLNWETIGKGITDEVVLDLALKGNDILAGTRKGLFVSNDDGNNWTFLSSQVKGRVSALAVVDSLIYAAEDGVIRYSLDNGLSWNVSAGIDSSNITAIYTAETAFFTLAGNVIYKSINKGKSWFKSDSGINEINDTTNAVNSLFLQNSIIYAATRKGVFLSKDNGASWSSISPKEVQINTTAVFASGNYILAGTETRGIYRSADNGKSWSLSNNGFINTNIDVVAGYDNILFAGVDRGYTYKTTDKGQSWSKLSLDTRGDPTSSILLIDNELYVSWKTGVPYKSMDEGLTWKTSYKGLPIINNILQMIHDEKNIYAATYKGVYYTPLHKDEWLPMNNGLTSLMVTSLVKDGDIIYASTIDGEGIYRTTDYGLNWTPFNYGITNKSVTKLCGIGNKLFADLNHDGFFLFNGSVWSHVEYPYFSTLLCYYVKDNYLVMGTGNGLWLTSDNGVSWNQENTGLTDKTVKSISVSGEYMYVGTWKGGVFMRPLSELIKQQSDVHKNEPVKTFSLLQNYPNPFNPATTIRYSIPEASVVTLKVFDLLGKEVKTLVNEFKSPGIYDVALYASDLPSGVYIYILQAGIYRENKKLVLLR